ncbi:MAG: VanZ family protein [Oscillospiraceae bacterium]|nr:VanZ family protein [Oscillospiraceae bacterium]
MSNKNYQKFGKIICIIVFIVYVVIILYITLFSRTPSARQSMLTPFWEYRELLYGADKLYWFGQIIGNIVMLMPLGVFLCLMCRRLNTIHIGMIGGACSVCIELFQYSTGRGLLEFDDIFHNTLGAVIGYIIMKKVTCANRQGE